MAFRYGFFDSEITGYDEEGMPQFDRAESSDFLALFIASIIRSGVLAVPGDNFQVMAGEGMTLLVRPGFGMLQGRFAYDDEESFFALPEADAKNRRIDRVILRANYPDRKCEILVRAGVPGAEPQPPELLRTSGDYYELCLAEVSVRANQSVIVQADITDTRADTDLCGWVTQTIEQVDTHTLFLQWQDAYQRYYDESTAEFETWLARIKAQLGEDVVSTLMEWITSLTERTNALETRAEDIEQEIEEISTVVEGLGQIVTTLGNSHQELSQKTETMNQNLSQKITTVEQALPNKAGKSTVVNTSLLAADWQGEIVPYTNTLTVEGVQTDSIVEVSLSKNASTDQVKASMNGQFTDGGQSENSITLKAYGRKPDMDIPVVVVVRRDV